MRVTLETRKPVTKLTVRDLRTFPIWEYALEEDVPGQDETWVRPVQSQVIRRGAYSQIVAAHFLTPTGRKLQGFMIVSTADGQVDIQAGAIVGRAGYRVIPRMSRALAVHRVYSWSLKERDLLAKALRVREAKAFPLSYELRVVIRGEKERRRGLLR
jgi:hypothetical protein